MKKIVLVIIVIFSILYVPYNSFASEEETTLYSETSSETVSNQVTEKSGDFSYGDIMIFLVLSILVGLNSLNLLFIRLKG